MFIKRQYPDLIPVSLQEKCFHVQGQTISRYQDFKILVNLQSAISSQQKAMRQHPRMMSESFSALSGTQHSAEYPSGNILVHMSARSSLTFTKSHSRAFISFLPLLTQEAVRSHFEMKSPRSIKRKVINTIKKIKKQDFLLSVCLLWPRVDNKL